MGRTIVITGGSGYFGTVLAERALARGDRVRILDVPSP
jgi:nucleoside-diphosphate-sugar epimerase